MQEATSTSTASSRLHGKVALITGGTTGIGHRTAERFRAEGARVVVTGATEASATRARESLPPDVLVIASDVRSADARSALADTIRERFGRLDVVFLNAGVASLGPIESVSEAAYDREFDINVKGVFFTFAALAPILAPGASVLVNTSVASHKGVASMSLYSATKGALSALVRSLAAEFAPQGVRVNAISPATILTPIQAKFGLPPEVQDAVKKDFEAKIPLGRFGESHEVAEAAVFLASDASSYVTGTELCVDGGLAAI